MHIKYKIINRLIDWLVLTQLTALLCYFVAVSFCMWRKSEYSERTRDLRLETNILVNLDFSRVHLPRAGFIFATPGVDRLVI